MSDTLSKTSLCLAEACKKGDLHAPYENVRDYNIILHIIIYYLIYKYYMQMLTIALEIYLPIVRNLVWSLCSSFWSTELTNALIIFHFEQAISAMSNVW